MTQGCDVANFKELFAVGIVLAPCPFGEQILKYVTTFHSYHLCTMCETDPLVVTLALSLMGSRKFVS